VMSKVSWAIQSSCHKRLSPSETSEVSLGGRIFTQETETVWKWSKKM
jgi:hypothetical protein